MWVIRLVDSTCVGLAGPQRAAVPIGQAAPDTVHDPAAERELQARLPDRA